MLYIEDKKSEVAAGGKGAAGAFLENMLRQGRLAPLTYFT